MILEEKYTLANGVEIPKIGLGTWFISDNDVVQAVKDAVKIGYRYIDTAQAYQNERGVGEGINAYDVDRNELFVTTKLAAEVKSYQEAVISIGESLKKLDLDYIDLMIIHSPKPWMEFHGANHYFDGNRREAWKVLEEAYQAGKLRSTGISNFEKADLDNILETCTVKPMVNQILARIGNTHHELIRYTQSQGILVEAYSPVAHGTLLKNQEVIKMAEKYKVSVPQLSIRYCLQLGLLLPLPKTANPEHMKNNAEVVFEISENDRKHSSRLTQSKTMAKQAICPFSEGN